MVHQCFSYAYALASHALFDDLIELMVDYGLYSIGLACIFVDIQLSIFNKNSFEDGLILL